MLYPHDQSSVLFKDKEFSESGTRFVPYINSQFIIPILLLLALGLLYYFNAEGISNFFSVVPKEDESMIGAFSHKIPMIVFIILAIAMGILSFIKKLSFIPVMGLLLCTYLMTELGVTNWLRFGLWLIVGLVIYFVYGYRNSHLGKATVGEQ